MTNETVRQKAHKGVNAIMDKADSMEKSGKEAVNSIKEKVEKVNEDAEGYIKEHPKRTVLIAAGIGAVVGGLGAAAMMRRKK